MRDLNTRFTLGLGLQKKVIFHLLVWGLGIPADVTKSWTRGEVHSVVGHSGF
jgi:hypothetical protein